MPALNLMHLICKLVESKLFETLQVGESESKFSCAIHSLEKRFLREPAKRHIPAWAFTNVLRPDP